MFGLVFSILVIAGDGFAKEATNFWISLCQNGATRVQSVVNQKLERLEAEYESGNRLGVCRSLSQMPYSSEFSVKRNFFSKRENYLRYKACSAAWEENDDLFAEKVSSINALLQYAWYLKEENLDNGNDNQHLDSLVVEAKRLIAQIDSVEQAEVKILLAIVKRLEGDQIAAKKLLEEAVISNDPVALREMGKYLIYVEGYEAVVSIVENSPISKMSDSWLKFLKGVSLVRAAAEAGDSHAQVMYYAFAGYDQSSVRASRLEYIKKAARVGQPEAIMLWIM